MPSLDDVAWPVRTERLVIRRERLDDVDASFTMRRQALIAHWLTTQVHDHAEFRQRWASGDWLEPMLVVERDGAFIGELMIKVGHAWAQSEVATDAERTVAEIGYTFEPAHHGRGYATEAVGAALRICFEDIGVRRVVAEAFADNLASRKVLERNGFRLENLAVKDSLHRDLGWIDGVTYALLADEWRARQGPH